MHFLDDQLAFMAKFEKDFSATFKGSGVSLVDVVSPEMAIVAIHGLQELNNGECLIITEGVVPDRKSSGLDLIAYRESHPSVKDTPWYTIVTTAAVVECIKTAMVKLLSIECVETIDVYPDMARANEVLCCSVYMDAMIVAMDAEIRNLGIGETFDSIAAKIDWGKNNDPGAGDSL
jgi:hypothetical protein